MPSGRTTEQVNCVDQKGKKHIATQRTRLIGVEVRGSKVTRLENVGEWTLDTGEDLSYDAAKDVWRTLDGALLLSRL